VIHQDALSSQSGVSRQKIILNEDKEIINSLTVSIPSVSSSTAQQETSMHHLNGIALLKNTSISTSSINPSYADVVGRGETDVKVK